jgi:gamma-glutamyl hercynylcysteine S-oxide synthase
MSKKDSPDTHSDIKDAAVQLRPILGIRPGVYLTALYGLVVLLLIFFFLFYPGLRNRGAYLSISTFPDRATVKVDGAYAGSTPCTIFLKSGNRSLEISKPFYTAVSFSQTVRGRAFGTLLVRDKQKTRRTLQVADTAGLLKWALADYQKNPEIPQIISDASFAAFSDQKAGSEQELYDFINNCMYFVTSETQLKQAILATARIAARGTFLTPSSLVSFVQQSIQLEQKYDNFPSWLFDLLSRENQARLSSTPYIQQYLAEYQGSISKYYQPPLSPGPGAGGAVSTQGIMFRLIPSGDAVIGKDDNLSSLGKTVDQLLAHPVHVDSFYLGVTEVTNGEYRSFVAENPDWAPASKDSLVQKGLVSDSYLSEWVDGKVPPGHDSLPVTSISWNAAVAFCNWLDQKAQAIVPGYHARLPLESEWEWAARGGLRGMPYPLGGKPGQAVFFQKGITGPLQAGTSEPNGYGLRDMLGNVWEWCANPFSPEASLLSSLDPRVGASMERSLPDAPDRAVRGGGWENQPGVAKVYTRGYQPSDWCTPYLGFRVALARR